MIGRVVGRLSGRAGLAADTMVAVGASDDGWDGGVSASVVTVGMTGPVRVHYSLAEPAGPTWLRHVHISERQRRRVLSAALGCGALEGAGVRLGPDQAAPHGWLHVRSGGRNAWTHLPEGRCLGGIAVFDMVISLVPENVWQELHGLCWQAYAAWVHERRGDARELNGERTLPDPYPPGQSGESGGDRHSEYSRDFSRERNEDQTVNDPPDLSVAPEDRRVAPIPPGEAGQGEGWPGARRGGGRGGVW
ncbi:hypothetical protein [Actinomadura sp. 6N118]|uniref:hypothetical protein n=1 Tax=Actinomadura sp. 6N118 TaxID=3375151 RepID=UPI0037A72F0A